jgi:nucleolar protein 58
LHARAHSSFPLPSTPSPPTNTLKQIVKLKAFDKFENTTEALAAATALVDSKLSKGGSQSNGIPPFPPLPAVACPRSHTHTLPQKPTRKTPNRNPGLKKFLKKHAEGDTLAVLDAKLGSLIKEKLGISCVAR